MTLSRTIAILFVGSLAAAALPPAYADIGHGDLLFDLPQPNFTSPPSQSPGAVPIPAFMKNAKKAKTSEGPKLGVKSR